jgi:uncharacterized protein YbjT (DUF2867 family)
MSKQEVGHVAFAVSGASGAVGHWHTEEHVRAVGLRYTFLRNNMYTDFLPAQAATDGVIRGPAGDGRVGAVACAPSQGADH